MTNPKAMAFYVPGQPKTGAIDLVVHGDDGVLRGAYSRRTQAELTAEYPGLQVGEAGMVADLQEQAYCHGPIEIGEGDFNMALECLPPVGWVRHGGDESFKMSERITGNITTIYARVASKFYKLTGNIRMPHGEIIQAIQAAPASEPAAPAM